MTGYKATAAGWTETNVRVNGDYYRTWQGANTGKLTIPPIL